MGYIGGVPGRVIRKLSRKFRARFELLHARFELLYARFELLRNYCRITVKQAELLYARKNSP